MSIFSDNLNKILLNRNIKASDIASHTGINKSNISAYLKGTNEPTIFKALLIADYLNVSMDYLLGRTKQLTVAPKNSYTLSEQEQSIIKQLRILPQEDRSHIERYLKFLIQENMELSE